MSTEITNSVKNYGFIDESDNASSGSGGVMASSEQAKAVQEVQAALTIAKKFPRSQAQAFESIMQACDRPFLAEQALYAYPKGGQIIRGPSIRLAEVLAQNWGNLSCGIKELSQSGGVSEVKAFAWDLQTNFYETKEFHVPHIRYTKKGSYKITDPREIYELVANQGARRLRACILAVIPGDIVDAAIERCESTLSSGKEPIADRVRKLISAFGELGVKVEHLEKRLGHKMESVIEQEMVTLRSIFKSIKDGFASREDFFEIGMMGEVSDSSLEDLIKNKSKPKLEQKPTKVDTETGEITNA